MYFAICKNIKHKAKIILLFGSPGITNSNDKIKSACTSNILARYFKQKRERFCSSCFLGNCKQTVFFI